MKKVYYELCCLKYTPQLRFLTNLIYKYLYYFLVRNNKILVEFCSNMTKHFCQRRIQCMAQTYNALSGRNKTLLEYVPPLESHFPLIFF